MIQQVCSAWKQTRMQKEYSHTKKNTYTHTHTHTHTQNEMKRERNRCIGIKRHIQCFWLYTCFSQFKQFFKNYFGIFGIAHICCAICRYAFRYLCAFFSFDILYNIIHNFEQKTHLICICNNMLIWKGVSILAVKSHQKSEQIIQVSDGKYETVENMVVSHIDFKPGLILILFFFSVFWTIFFWFVICCLQSVKTKTHNK